MKRVYYLLFTIGFSLLLYSCSVGKKIGREAKKTLLNDSAIASGHMGICIYEPVADKYWYNYNASHYFIPASNTKLFTLYAGMKYLGDSLVGLRYTENNLLDIDSLPRPTDLVKVFPTGDPTFLHPEFKYQPVFEFLKKRRIFRFCDFNEIDQYGKGWAWNDYMEDYMIPRTTFPMYNNLAEVKFIRKDSVRTQPSFLIKKMPDLKTSDSGFKVYKNFGQSGFSIGAGKEKFKKIPFNPDFDISGLLTDTIKEHNVLGSYYWQLNDTDLTQKYKLIHSQPSDSLFKPMMHRSDNFFAEQTLLMASNEYLGYMSDEKMIDTILKSSLNSLPQRPKWVDGSGLSRYNLMTPQSIVFLLNKMKNEFGMNRLKEILPTGGEGTLSSYYRNIAGNIYAKTGTLSNNCALSGFLITKKGRLLVFSCMNNNYITGAAPVRRAVEKFLLDIQEKY